MSSFNLPEGCKESDLPGNPTEEIAWENALEEAAQHQDRLVMQRALVEQLVEVRSLINSCLIYPSHFHVTWLNEKDIENIACACGVQTEYLQAIKPKEEHDHANR